MDTEALEMIDLFMIDFEKKITDTKGVNMNFDELQKASDYGAHYVLYLREKLSLDQNMRVLEGYPFSEEVEDYIEKRFEQIMDKQ